uniref:Insulin like peptide-1 n=1 Tax=Tigriopus japonicus TaxID=158387 RepID=A0A1L1WRE1_TIGJA|nr:insulin like peptide-1 [Tigriopus japonicus]
MFCLIRNQSAPQTFHLRSLGLLLGLGLLIQCCSADPEWANQRFVDYTGNFPSSQLEDQHQIVDITVPAQLIDKKSGMERACGNLLANHMQLLCSGKRKRSGFQSFYPMGRQQGENAYTYQSLQKRGILDQCCYQPCSKATLMRFCP